MEKLQEALQKARADRAQSEARAHRADSIEPEAPETQVDLAWAALTDANLDTPHLVRNRIVSYDHSRGATPFDILRTKVILQMRKHGWRRLAITSATASCGKSTIACNLALGLSRQADLRSIVLELDLRNPSMMRMLGVEPPHDITRVLSGQLPFGKQALRVRGNVALGLARGRATDPTRFLLSQSTEDALATIEADYAPDLMVFDTPPLMVSDDTRAFLGKVDCAMIVARADATTIGHIDSCEREVADHTNVLGVVLNQARHVDNDTGYGYGYGD